MGILQKFSLENRTAIITGSGRGLGFVGLGLRAAPGPDEREVADGDFLLHGNDNFLANLPQKESAVHRGTADSGAGPAGVD